MKKLLCTIAMTWLGVSLWAGPIDGRWRAETKMPEGKAKKSGTMVSTFDLKSDGGKLTGTVEMGRGKRNRTAEIRNGTIDGDHFSFSTVMQTKKGERAVTWEGTLSGSEIKGSTGRGKRSIAFTAKRQ